jgi:hypothetical protein
MLGFDLRTTRSKIATGAALFAIAGGWLLIAGSHHAGTSSSARAVRSSDPTPIEPERQERSFGVLRTPPEPPSFDMVRAIARTVAGQGFNLMLERAQRVWTTVGENAWVVPGDGYICVMRDETAVAGCNTTQETIREGMTVVIRNQGRIPAGSKRYLLLGIAPDGIKAAKLVARSGHVLTVPVIDNVFAARSVTLIRPAGLLRR